ncbi:hypothetical protein AJ79_08197 [Helicocarpus griseus UAMH5409]|uniref:Helicase-associated domain-containing protein n=1 Tax=Helicocarpus griseus UAMH5409 TaxID=1447875 RepID=A0A2B7WUN2_9EURO|nr:hypothetical protein AJ79_08197 [Helicocarpus griseus UAMH5409]
MRDSVLQAKKGGLLDAKADLKNLKNLSPIDQFRRQMPLPDRHAIEHRSEKLKMELMEWRQDKAMEDVRSYMKLLPSSGYEERILKLVNANIFSIVVGHGTTELATQIPHFLLNDAIDHDEGPACNIVVAHVSSAITEHFASKLARLRNKVIGDTVGYHTPSSCKAPLLTGSITYTATETLLTQLQHAPDEVLGAVSHIIIGDLEVIEPAVEFLMTTLKQAVHSRLDRNLPVPQVVLTSRGLDIADLAPFFTIRDREGKAIHCRSLSIDNKSAYPVEQHYIDDILKTFAQRYNGKMFGPFFNERRTKYYLAGEEALVSKKMDPETDGSENANSISSYDSHALGHLGVDRAILPPLGLVAVTIAHIVKSSDAGTILVSVPTSESVIMDLKGILSHEKPLNVDFADQSKFQMIWKTGIATGWPTEALNSDTTPEGRRKIIFINDTPRDLANRKLDVRYVVDTGLQGTYIYDQELSRLRLRSRWTSKADLRYRIRQAGNVKDGQYYALFSRTRSASLKSCRGSILHGFNPQRSCLEAKASGLRSDVRDFICSTIDPPPRSHVESAVNSLQSIEALDDSFNMTPLGHLIPLLKPLDPTIVKMVGLGLMFRCLEPMILLSSLFGLEINKPKRKRFYRDSVSDHLVDINAIRKAYDVWRNSGDHALKPFCEEHYLDRVAVFNSATAIRAIVRVLSEVGLMPRPNNFHDRPLGGKDLNTNSYNEVLIRALLVGGLYPRLSVFNLKGENRWRTKRWDGLEISKSSVNYSQNDSIGERERLVAFSNLQAEKGKLRLFGTSHVTPLMAFLFGGKVQVNGNYLEMDGWLPFKIKDKSTSAYPEAAEKTLQDALIEYKRTLNHFRDPLRPSARQGHCTHISIPYQQYMPWQRH